MIKRKLRPVLLTDAEAEIVVDILDIWMEQSQDGIKSVIDTDQETQDFYEQSAKNLDLTTSAREKINKVRRRKHGNNS